MRLYLNSLYLSTTQKSIIRAGLDAGQKRGRGAAGAAGGQKGTSLEVSVPEGRE